MSIFEEIAGSSYSDPRQVSATPDKNTYSQGALAEKSGLIWKLDSLS